MTYVIQDQMTRGIRNLLVMPSDNPCGTENTPATPSEIQNGRGIVPKPTLEIRGDGKAIRQALWKSEGPENRFGSDSENPNDRKTVSKAVLKIRSGGKAFGNGFRTFGGYEKTFRRGFRKRGAAGETLGRWHPCAASWISRCAKRKPKAHGKSWSHHSQNGKRAESMPQAIGPPHNRRHLPFRMETS